MAKGEAEVGIRSKKSAAADRNNREEGIAGWKSRQWIRTIMHNQLSRKSEGLGFGEAVGEMGRRYRVRGYEVTAGHYLRCGIGERRKPCWYL